MVDENHIIKTMAEDITQQIYSFEHQILSAMTRAQHRWGKQQRTETALLTQINLNTERSARPTGRQATSHYSYTVG